MNGAGSSRLRTIAVLGSGAWGTALALSLAERGHAVTLWSHSERVPRMIAELGENRAYLPGIPIPRTIRSTGDAVLALQHAEIVLGAMPSEHVRATYTDIASLLREEQLLVSSTKGLEDGSSLRMSEVISQVCGRRHIAVLSGPSFAAEVAAGLPTAVTIACEDAVTGELLQECFSSPRLRIYTNEDVIGVELGGALKNVIAIAAGVAAGLQLGHNAMAALITRGIAEVTRLAIACGGRRETLAGLSGIGDLVLTCTGALSRNRSVGMALGQGRTLEETLQALGGKVAEGVRTTPAALRLASRLGVEMPITKEMNNILNFREDPHEAMRSLMGRPGRDE